MQWPSVLTRIWPSRAHQRRASLMQRDGGIVVVAPGRSRWAKWHPVSRARQRGFIRLSLGFGGARFRPQQGFANGEPGLHFETYDPNALLRRRNRLTYSSKFENAAWTRTNILSVTPSADGVGDLVVPNAALGFPSLGQLTAGLLGVSNAFTVRAKAGGYSHLLIQFNGGGRYFNLSNGTVGSGHGGVNALPGTISPAVDAPGYYDCTVAGLPQSVAAYINVANADGSAQFVGDGASGIYLARAQLEWNTTAASEYQEVTDWNAEYLAAALQRVGMWQDWAGLIPVTGVEQPVGLWFDSRYGLARDPDIRGSGVVGLVGAATAATYNPATGVGSATRTDATNQSFVQFSGLAATDTYEIFITNNDASDSAAVRATPSSAAVLTVPPGTSASCRIYTAVGTITITSAGGTVDFTLTAFRKVAGNHATQASSPSRGVLTARANLKTKTEQFDDTSVYTRTQVSFGASATSPRGDATAQLLLDSAVNGLHRLQEPTGTTIAANSPYVATLRIKQQPGSTRWLEFGFGDTTFASFIVNYVNPATGALGTPASAGGVFSNVSWEVSTADAQGFYTITCRFTSTSTTNRSLIGIASGDAANVYAGNATGFYVWGLDLRPADEAAKSVPVYQRVNTSTDYDTDGFVHYVKFDGVDDFLATAGIDFSGVDKIAIWFPFVQEVPVGACGVELSAAPTTTAGTFRLGPTTTNHIFAGLRGTADNAYTYSPAASLPKTRLVTLLGDLGAATALAELQVRVDGAVVAPASTLSVGPSGTGNLSNNPVYIGRRGGASLPAQIKTPGLTIRGSTTPTSEAFIAKMNRYSANLMKTAVTS